MARKLRRSEALRNERQGVLDFCRTLSDDEWRAPSNAKGWRLQDVVAHMGGAYHGLFQPGWVLGLLRTDALERGNDADAAKRSDWDPQQVLAEYETWSKRAIGTLAATAKTPATALPLRLGELGAYPAGLFLSAFTFDHHTHVWHDMAEAIGRPHPGTDDNRMAVAFQWMFAGAEQMHGDEMAFLDRPVAVTLDGPGGGTWRVGPGKKPGRLRCQEGDASGTAAQISAQSLQFPLWATKRKPWWDSDVTIAGDEDYGKRFLDALKVV